MDKNCLELVPTGTLRCGINFGNTVLARRDENGRPKGIAADLAIELANRLSVSVEFVTYDAAGRMADGAEQNSWDVAFLAADPDRANQIAFTGPYLEIDTTYLVPAESPFCAPEEMDRDGIRISVSQRSAYDLFLTRSLRQAQLVRSPSPTASVEVFVREKLEALAGIRPMLMDVARQLPGTRVLNSGFMSVRQAIGTPRGRDDAARFLNEFVKDIVASGLVLESIKKNGILGVSVARPAREGRE